MDYAALVEGYITGMLMRDDSSVSPDLSVSIEHDETGRYRTIVTMDGRRFVLTIQPEAATLIQEVI